MKNFESSPGYKHVISWLQSNGRSPFGFQVETWAEIYNGNSGLVNAPTGYGKTYSVFLGAVINFINQHPEDYKSLTANGLQMLWITPLRALGKDIARAMAEALEEMAIPWKVGIRNGDTSSAERQQQKRRMPEILIITPESLHLMLANKGYPEIFKTLQVFVVDEWHELIGSKRGVQVELALSRIAGLNTTFINKRKPFCVWGISATIGNLEEARDVILQPLDISGKIISAKLHKKTDIISIYPDEIEKYPWAGHLGIKLADKILPVLKDNATTLIFINTRSMSEQWYQQLLNIEPDLAGVIALHHGSIERELRDWVEDALHTGSLKAVVTTSSLDLGVDFRPVEMVVQVGSPKGVARFLQRAGRSGHRPDAISKIYFLPTHSLELMECAALKEAVELSFIEKREPLVLCYDVLIQYLSTLAVSEGFYPDIIFEEIKKTNCFKEILPEEWISILNFITEGGKALNYYDDFKKVEIVNGLYIITSRKMAMRHRMHIGTIVSDPMVKVKLLAGTYIGMIEESFISKLKPGDTFTLAGRILEFVMVKEMTAVVKKSKAQKAIFPNWTGGRMPLSSNLGFMLRKKLNEVSKAFTAKNVAEELVKLKPLFDLQKKLSSIPAEGQLLIEHIETKDGFHLFVYPFEGRLVHEAMAALLAFRLSKIIPITFSIAMNDYGFELLSDIPIPLDDANVYELFSENNLYEHILQSVNASEMAKRKFRDIATIGGLIFPGKQDVRIKARHLQSSASLLFNVFAEYDPDNLLLRQAYNEVMYQQMDEVRLRNMLQRIQNSEIVINYPKKLTPFCFPIKVDSLRENISSEKLSDRIKKMSFGI